jgi:ketosteroid isomerase-like protein
MVRLVALVALLLVPRLAAAQVADPVLGTWQLNVAKSTFAPAPTPKSAVRTYAVAGGLTKATDKTTDAAGKVLVTSWTVSYDGKEQRIVGDPDSDAQILTQVDPLHTEGTIKLKGKVVGKTARAITNDGKTMTITYTGTDAKGQHLHQVSIWEKVQASGQVDKAQQELVRIEREWCTALVKRDAPALSRILADDYKAVASRGAPSDKAGDLADMKAKDGMSSCVDDKVDVRVFGDTAIVMGHGTRAGTYKGAAYKNREIYYTDVFVRRNGSWQCVASEGTVAAAQK